MGDGIITIAVEIIDVSKKYEHLWALNSLSTKIDEGDSVAILGPNGAGKTTLLKIIATHVSPSSGIVKIYGRNAFKDSEKIKRQIGFVAHESFLYDELTLKENLSFYGRFFSANQDDVHGVIELLNLTDYYEAPVKRLSYGLRKRADIARALIHNPALILLDELFAGLDEEARRQLVNYLKNQPERTLLVSSHSIEWAKQLCSRGIFLNEGNIVQDIRF